MRLSLPTVLPLSFHQQQAGSTCSRCLPVFRVAHHMTEKYDASHETDREREREISDIICCANSDRATTAIHAAITIITVLSSFPYFFVATH